LSFEKHNHKAGLTPKEPKLNKKNTKFGQTCKTARD